MNASETLVEVANSCEQAYLRIKEDVAKTPCLSSRQAKGLFFKTENFQKTGSFKLRGAMSKLTSLTNEVPIITASSGNHGIACSHAAMTTGHSLTVVLPENVAKAKLEKIESYGTTVMLNPGDSGLAEQQARKLSEKDEYVYVSPYNDPMVMAGQGTIGLEILEQLPNVDNVFISLGGGGLVSGIGAVIKTAKPEVQVFGISAMNSAALSASIRAGKVVETEHLDTLADGCAGGVDEGSITLPVASEVIDHLIECSEEEISNAIKLLAWEENMIVEGAAGLAYAGYLAQKANISNQKSIVLLCGSNFDKEIIQAVIA